MKRIEFHDRGQEIGEISKRYLVKGNILFADPLTRMIKPQSQLDLVAIRDVVA